MEGRNIIRAHLQCYNGNEYTFGGDNSGKIMLSLLKRCLFYKKIIYSQREQILGVHYSKRKATRASPFAEIAKYLPIIYQESTLHSAVELKFLKGRQNIIEPAHYKTYNTTCATRKDSE